MKPMILETVRTTSADFPLATLSLN